MRDREIDRCAVPEVHHAAVADALAALSDDETLYDLADLFKLFGDFTRVKILSLLDGRELCVCDIAEALDMNQSAISHQLRVLKAGKLVKSRRDGKSAYYSLADDHVLTILEQGMEHINE